MLNLLQTKLHSIYLCSLYLFCSLNYSRFSMLRLHGVKLVNLVEKSKGLGVNNEC